MGFAMFPHNITQIGVTHAVARLQNGELSLAAELHIKPNQFALIRKLGLITFLEIRGIWSVRHAGRVAHPHQLENTLVLEL